MSQLVTKTPTEHGVFRSRWPGMVLLLLGLIGAPLWAQDYNNGMIRGTYGMFLLPLGGGLPVAANGIIRFDGNGAVTGGRVFFNEPDGRFDQRRLVEYAVTGGSYNVDELGMGTLFTEGLPLNRWQLLIHEMDPPNNSGAPRYASGLRITGDAVDPFGANLLHGEAHRRPDGAVFDESQLLGLYVRRFTGHGGFAQLAAFGKVMIDGQGGVEGQGNTIVNLPGQTLGTRSVTGSPAFASVEMDGDGIGTISVEGGASGTGSGKIVALRAKNDKNGNLIALDAYIIFNGYFDLGNLTSLRATLQFVPE